MADEALGYLAPERLEGAPARPIDELFTLGSWTFQAVHGRLPFPAARRSRAEVIAAVRAGRRARPPLPEPYPEALRGWIDALLAPAAQDRPADAAAALRGLIAASGLSHPLETPSTRTAHVDAWLARRLDADEPMTLDDSDAAQRNPAGPTAGRPPQAGCGACSRPPVGRLIKLRDLLAAGPEIDLRAGDVAAEARRLRLNELAESAQALQQAPGPVRSAHAGRSRRGPRTRPGYDRRRLRRAGAVWLRLRRRRQRLDG